MSSTETILKFLIFLSQVRNMFRQTHLYAEQNPALRTVSTTVIPFKGIPSIYADEGVTISIALNTELLKPIDSEKKAIGMSLLLRHTEGVWLSEAEIGWTGEEIGWDVFDSKEAHAKSIEEIIIIVPPLVEWMDIKFREEMDKLPK